MRIFFQISVGGFKIFDVREFSHKGEQGVYVLMPEIAATHEGTENFHTHIVKSDMHGMRYDILHLFSTRDIKIILQNDLYNNRNSRCLFIRDCAKSQDGGRTCDIAFCVFSEDDIEKDIVNKMAFDVLVQRESRLLKEIPNLIHTVIIGNEQVLMFETLRWEALCHELEHIQVCQKNKLGNSIINGSEQFVVLYKNNNKFKVINEQTSLFNDSPYYILYTNELPLESKTISTATKDHEYLKKLSNPDKHHGFIFDALKSLFDLK